MAAGLNDVGRARRSVRTTDLVVEAGFWGRRLVAAEVAEWEEVAGETGGGSAAVGAVGKIVAGAVLPGFRGKVAGAALDATLGSTARPPRTIRVDWLDGKQSLIRLPEKRFTHLTVVLQDRQVAALVPGSTPAPPSQHLAWMLRSRSGSSRTSATREL